MWANFRTNIDRIRKRTCNRIRLIFASSFPNQIFVFSRMWNKYWCGICGLQHWFLLQLCFNSTCRRLRNWKHSTLMLHQGTNINPSSALELEMCLDVLLASCQAWTRWLYTSYDWPWARPIHIVCYHPELLVQLYIIKKTELLSSSGNSMKSRNLV